MTVITHYYGIQIMTTVKQLVTDIKKTGHIHADVSNGYDCIRLPLVKAELLQYLKRYDPQSAAPWTVRTDDDGIRFLCTLDSEY